MQLPARSMTPKNQVEYNVYMQKFWHKHHILILSVTAVLSVAAIVLGGWAIWQARHPQSKPASTLLNTVVTSPTQPLVSDLNSLQIEAIKARTYTASTLTVEQDLGNQGNYTSQVVSYISDGFKVYALQATPAGTAPAGGWPVVILNHGYINPATYHTNDGSYAGITGALARAGILVLKPDFRGHGQSQGTSAGGHFSPFYTYDNLNLIATLKQTPGVNAARIGTVGHSMGAHTSLRVAVVDPDIKATAYLSGVIASINDITYNWPRSPMSGDLPVGVQTTREALFSQYGTPQTNPVFWSSVSAINYVSSITGKSQIHQSVADSTVPKSFSDSLNAALVAADKPVNYYLYPGDDHQLSANSALVTSRIVEFFKRNL
jgi:dipeptidyl aminopeptidase/acylaminoacyl peptidase